MSYRKIVCIYFVFAFTECRLRISYRSKPHDFETDFPINLVFGLYASRTGLTNCRGPPSRIENRLKQRPRLAYVFPNRYRRITTTTVPGTRRCVGRRIPSQLFVRNNAIVRFRLPARSSSFTSKLSSTN